MKKLILIIFSFVFLSSNIFANDKNLNEFNEWLYQSGNDQYINIEQSPGCKKLIQKHGLKVPKVGLIDEPKVKTNEWFWLCLLYTSPSPRDRQKSRMPSSA